MEASLWKWRSRGASATLVLAGALLCVAGGCRGHEVLEAGARIEPGGVPYEYENGGIERTTIAIDASSWAHVQDEFEGVNSAGEERDATRDAVRRFEVAAGEQTPTWQDRPRSTPIFGTSGQLDCIAESNNTTTFLCLLRQEGLLRFHEVLRPEFRTQYLLFDPHRSALIRERGTGTVYAVDSWVGAAGEAPIVQEYRAWRRKEGPSAAPRE